MKQIAALGYYDNCSIRTECMNVCKQYGRNHCGLMSIAYATCLIFDQDPVNLRFDQSQMRTHLLKCLENGMVHPFPVVSHRSVCHQILCNIEKALYCTCWQIYIEGDLMIQCTLCEGWFHPACQHISNALFEKYSKKEKSTFKCSLCE